MVEALLELLKEAIKSRFQLFEAELNNNNNLNWEIFVKYSGSSIIGMTRSRKSSR